MKMLKNQEKGRTLVEMMGVISIISLLSITSIGGYNYLTSKWKISGLEDALLKTVLVVDGSQVRTIKALDRFLVQSMKGFDASASKVDTCELQDRHNNQCYRITFNGVDKKIVSYFEDLEVSQYRVNKGETDASSGKLIIEFASNKVLSGN
ncbi:MAG: hypothetical protein IKL90_06015 [Alphaproteobacteria bacterium]|nr:hypothetical protein [Alphaproteobacteria bacterium]